MSKIKNGIVTLDTPVVDSDNGYTIVNVDLNKLTKERIAQDSEMEGIKLNKAFTPFRSNKNDSMIMKFNLEYNNDTESLDLVGKVTQGDKVLFDTYVALNVEQLVVDILDSLAQNTNNNVSLASLEMIRNAVDTARNTIYSKCFKENILLSNEEFNYRIDIFKAGTNNLLALGNRLSISDDTITLYEVIAFDSNATFDKVDIRVVINEEEAIYFKSLSLNTTNGKSIKYCGFSLNNAQIAKKSPNKNEKYNPEKLKLKGLELPAKESNTEFLLRDLLNNNDHNLLMKCYKQNKKLGVVKVNLNKYLLS